VNAEKAGVSDSDFILGTPGGGMSFASKQEIICRFIETDGSTLTVDPEKEYNNGKG
jgi:hypothetical protein